MYRYKRVFKEIPEGEWLFPSQIKDIVSKNTELSKKQVEGHITRLKNKDMLETKKFGKTNMYKKEGDE